MKLDKQQLITAVIKTVSPNDGMFRGNMEHYLSCGESAAQVLLAAIGVAAHKIPERILDFGSGAGRVTRWLMALFPAATIHACDVKQQDVSFLNETLGVKAWAVQTDLEALELPKLYYDLIWVGSVITHLPEPKTRQLIEKLFAACAPRGILAISFHGRTCIARQDRESFRYIHDGGWNTIKSDYARRGYGYADYEGQSGYGISVLSMAWMATLVETIPTSKLILLSEQAWDGHHDVVAIQKTA